MIPVVSTFLMNYVTRALPENKVEGETIALIKKYQLVYKTKPKFSAAESNKHIFIMYIKPI